MKARLMLKERRVIADNAFAELIIWQLPQPIAGSMHPYKYRFALVVDGVCVLRYDNERGKGDHRHLGGMEELYNFTSPQNLLNDFWRDVDQWRLK
jgi:hypothetical protein